MRYHFTHIRIAVIKVRQEITRMGKGVERLEPLCLAPGNMKWYNCYGKLWQFLSKLNTGTM